MKQQDYPSLYQSASDLSQRAQNLFYRAFLTHMVLLAVAAGMSVINSPYPAAAILQTSVLLSALFSAVYLYLVRPDRHWYSGRAVAESIKTTVWRYISVAEPFNNSDSLDKHNFGLKLRAIVDQNKDVAGLLTTHLDGPQITIEMERLRKNPLKDRIDYYKNNRILDQQSWYANKASTNRRMVNKYFIALFITISVSIFFSVTRILYPTAPYWPTDFFVTVAAGLLSWIQAKRFQELSTSYALAAHEISLIREQADAPKTADDFSKFVGDAENAFSREHTQWTARKDS